MVKVIRLNLMRKPVLELNYNFLWFIKLLGRKRKRNCAIPYTNKDKKITNLL